MPPPAHDVAPEKPLRERILDVMALYPEPRSAIIPALRLAQEEYGVALNRGPRGGRRRDRLHAKLGRLVLRHVPGSRPRARTRSARAPTCRGARRRLATPCASSSASSASTPARPHPTGCSRCARSSATAGCGWGPVVSVDERYHEPCGPEQVEGILQELRGGGA